MKIERNLTDQSLGHIHSVLSPQLVRECSFMALTYPLLQIILVVRGRHHIGRIFHERHHSLIRGDWGVEEVQDGSESVSE